MASNDSIDGNGIVPMKLDGNAAASSIKADIARRVKALNEQGVKVGLGTLMVGDDPASMRYVNGKHRDCADVGIVSIRSELPAFATTEEVLAEVRTMNADPDITGFITQLPLPAKVDEQAVVKAMDASKDADGLQPENLGALMLDVDGTGSYPRPCTPAGIVKLLEMNGISLNGMDVCLIGRGITAGRPLAALLTSKAVNATVDICHTGTENLIDHIREAQVVISAVGSEWFIKPDWIASDAILVDVGVSRVMGEDGKYHVHGDFHPYCRSVCAAYTPNPGGIGPMTRAMLLENVVSIAERNHMDGADTMNG